MAKSTSDREGFLVGLKESTFTMSGQWDDAHDDRLADTLKPRSSPVTVYPGSVDCFGLTWWRERWSFEATIIPNASGADVQATGPVRREQAEWWRRIGFSVLRHLPIQEKAEEA